MADKKLRNFDGVMKKEFYVGGVTAPESVVGTIDIKKSVVTQSANTVSPNWFTYFSDSTKLLRKGKYRFDIAYTWNYSKGNAVSRFSLLLNGVQYHFHEEGNRGSPSTTKRLIMNDFDHVDITSDMMLPVVFRFQSEVTTNTVTVYRMVFEIRRVL